MSDAAQAVEAVLTESSDEAVSEHVPGVDPDQELPDFNIYEDVEAEESQVGTSGEESKEEEKAQEPKSTWTARVKKDRQLRQKDIAFKKREHELAAREQKVTALEDVRKSLLDNPNEFLKSQGIDPLDFYADWTNRIASGRNEPSPKTRLSATEKELKDLKEQLANRDKKRSEEHTANEQQQVLGQYYQQIDEFKASSEEYPLTKEQCSSQDIAEGIGAYFRETGIELGFKDAFKMIEDGLRTKESEIFNNPAIIAKFKKIHGLDASKGTGRRSHTTLSNNLGTQPTKTPAEDMSDDEIHEFWKGKLFT